MGRSIHGVTLSKKKTCNKGAMGSVAVGAAISLIGTTALTGLEMWLANKGLIPIEMASMLSVVVWCLSGLMGGYISSKGLEKGTALRGLACGSIYALLLLILTGIGFRARFEGVLKGIAIILASAAMGGILASFQRGKGRKIRPFR